MSGYLSTCLLKYSSIDNAPKPLQHLVQILYFALPIKLQNVMYLALSKHVFLIILHPVHIEVIIGIVGVSFSISLIDLYDYNRKQSILLIV